MAYHIPIPKDLFFGVFVGFFSPICLNKALQVDLEAGGYI